MRSLMLGKWYAVLLVLMFLVKTRTCFDYCKKSCKTSKHTMCLYHKEDPGALCKDLDVSKGLTDEDKINLVKYHNNLRSKVAQGKETLGDPGPQPPASNMMELVWDNELEEIAKRWSLQCDYKHDGCRLSMDGGYVGQNIAVSYDSIGFRNDIEGQVNSWYKEVEFTTKETAAAFVSGSTDNGDIGHYTQLVWAETKKIGCARVYFDFDDWGMSEYLVCNYGVGGNVKGRPLYKTGSSCSACSGGLACSRTYPGLCAAPTSTGATPAATTPETIPKKAVPTVAAGRKPTTPSEEESVPSTNNPNPNTSASSGCLPWMTLIILMPSIFATSFSSTIHL